MFGEVKFGGLLGQVVTRSDSDSGVQKNVPGKVVVIGFAWFTVGEIWGYRAFLWCRCIMPFTL